MNGAAGWAFAQPVLILATPLSHLALQTRFLQERSRRYRMAVACVGILALMAIAFSFNVSFSDWHFNLAAFVLGWGCYCFLAACATKIGNKRLQWSAATLMHLPILIGCLAVFSGLLTLALIMCDSSVKRVAQTPEFSCEEEPWGMAGGASGYTIALYAHWPGLPLIERRMYRVSVDLNSVSPEQGMDTCDSVFNAYRMRSAHR